MNDLPTICWQLAIAFSLLGSILVRSRRDALSGRHYCIGFSGIVLLLATFAWWTFDAGGGATQSRDFNVWYLITGLDWFAIDKLSAPLLPLAALLHVLVALTTPRTETRRFPFAGILASQTCVLTTLCCIAPWGIIALLAVACFPQYFELRRKRRPTRVYVLHMALFVVCLGLGQAALQAGTAGSPMQLAGIVLLLLGVLVRSGVAPFHCWITDLFEHAAFGSALLTVVPMLGAYAAVRLSLPVTPHWLLQIMSGIAALTALYAAGMALVARESRRFFSYSFISHSAMVLVGVDTVSSVGLTGALSIWLAIALAMTGLGLTLRALESRHGRLSLAAYHGVYEHTPQLAICFFLTGLASVGFPGTFGFLGSEMLVDGVVQALPLVGLAVVAAAAINGIALVKVYFRLFTGTRHVSSVPLQIGWQERVAVLTIAALIFGEGLFPQRTIDSRREAAEELLTQRAEQRGAPTLVIVKRPSKRTASKNH